MTTELHPVRPLTRPADPPHRAPRPEPAPGHGRWYTGTAWAVLLLGLWLWGGDAARSAAVAQLTTTGDIAAVGRPPGPAAPRAHPPLPATTAGAPRALTVPALGLRTPLTPGPPDAAAVPAARADGPAGWYAYGPQPGTPGAAVLLGRGPTAGAPARLTPGARLDLHRADGSTARFTVADVRLYPPGRALPATATAARDPHRAELRLITRRPTAPTVVVSAFLSSYGTGHGGR
ncbi:class F sortase [Streptomyces catenulae]|uniref:Class F sortase n=1 Tax=Streptomyces catenulae TaxID=66875 RepID=A0ABV2Z808_9ACTN|nr:class F sortase [Streptomyces catenulae]